VINEELNGLAQLNGDEQSLIEILKNMLSQDNLNENKINEIKSLIE